jgi:hypothetical protein
VPRSRSTPVASLLFLFPVSCALLPVLHAQQAAPPPTPIAYVPTAGVTVSGSLSVANGEAVIGSSGAVTAVDKAAGIRLARGGTLRLCSTTTVHLSSDRNVTDAQSSALMMSLDRGALEASYTAGKYSDVLITPDLRILISGPGQVDLKIRVNARGDTCVDNHGTAAPYVTVTSLLDGGLYRVQPNQRVLFEHGDLKEVVDNEAEPCGCPPAAPVAVAGAGGPSSTAADIAFPLAQSEGLAPAPPLPTTPAVPPGQAHAQVTVPLVYDSGAPPPSPPADMVPAPQPAPPPPARKRSGFFGKVGHFFTRLFGGE